ncbi:helix-turn-helix domain-containing protein [Pseudochrobactrum asaccharolyticum]|uniref:Helix-turn-helix protein n=1 Tax=Pseudochrobactrum asaccharolyticum TaxID=354351 RepID=A0A366DGU1_9HYPH|nr:helix-turn-helix domain-containing protein [Pseudochrobactrum asaccharolyticum]RBO89292.1 hypothetical protein DFR47_11620 [Pseudochrobactrum asaccharolyticum]
MSQEATIRRGVRNARYAAIPNHVFEDMRLSMEARWLLGYLLSKPDNWTVVQKDIANKGGCGRDKARKMIAELVDAGYAEKEQARDAGRFGGMSLVIYDEPLNGAPSPQKDAGSVAFVPQTEMPSTVKPSTETPSTVNPALVSTDNLENTDYRSERGVREENSNSQDIEDHKALDRSFWKIIKDWPKINGMPKDRWFAAWCELTPDERIEAAEMRDAWLAILKANGRDHVPVPEKYFRQKLWKEVPSASVKSLMDDGLDGRVKAPAFGNMWAANIYRELWAGVTEFQTLDSIEQELVEKGRFTAEHILRGKQSRYGFPNVNMLFDRATAFRGLLVSADLKPISSGMVAVPVGGDVWHELQDEHAKRGWPWFPKPGKQTHVWLPNGVAGLNELQDLWQGLDK